MKVGYFLLLHFIILKVYYTYTQSGFKQLERRSLYGCNFGRISQCVYTKLTDYDDIMIIQKAMNKIYIFKDFPEGEKKIIVSDQTKIIPAKKITNNSKIEQKSIR